MQDARRQQQQQKAAVAAEAESGQELGFIGVVTLTASLEAAK